MSKLLGVRGQLSTPGLLRYVPGPDLARLEHLSTKRQDLLEPFLRGDALEGRFSSERTGWVIAFLHGHGTWTALQQELRADALVDLLSDEHEPVPALRQALLELTKLAFISSERVIAFADDERPPLREIAVRALGRLDEGQGFPKLLECLGDDRARWAIYSVRAQLREMPSAEAATVLATMPMKRVTVAKEVVRLLGEFGGNTSPRRTCFIMTRWRRRSAPSGVRRGPPMSRRGSVGRETRGCAASASRRSSLPPSRSAAGRPHTKTR